MPKAGYQGTLLERFISKDMQHLRGQIRAKTGSLTEPIVVSSLAGYLFHKQHGLIAFALIENGKKGKKQPLLSTLQQRQEKNISTFYNNL